MWKGTLHELNAHVISIKTTIVKITQIPPKNNQIIIISKRKGQSGHLLLQEVQRFGSIVCLLMCSVQLCISVQLVYNLVYCGNSNNPLEMCFLFLLHSY